MPRRIKIEAWYHLTANISYPLMIVLSALLMPAMIIRFYQGWFQMLLIDLPLFMASTFSSVVVLSGQAERAVSQDLVQDVSVSAVPDGAGHRAHRHQYQSRDGSTARHPVAFKRTPKYRVEKKSDKTTAARKYRKRLGIVPWIELAIGTYFALTVIYAVTNQNYITVPFLLLFVLGYWYTGLMSLLQGRFERFSLRDPQAAAAAATDDHKPFPVGV